MTKSPFEKLLKQCSYYFSSNTLLKLAGFISFPIYTRIFSRSEYGLINIADVTLLFAVTVAKLGSQHSALRFYPEFKEGKRDLDISYYYGTALLTTFMVSLLAATGYGLGLEIIFKNSQSPEFLLVLRFLILLIIIEGVERICFTFLRAEENAKLYSILDVVSMYLRISSVVLFVVLLRFGMIGFFVGRVFISGAISIVLITKLILGGKLKRRSFSFPLSKELLAYGVPLFGFELANVLLALGDRYILQYYMGAEAVGLYVASYSVVTYAATFFCQPLKLGAMPILMRIWEQHGKIQAQEFLSRLLKYYFMISIPVFFGLIAVGRECLVLLASNKFEAGYIVIPYISVGLIAFNAHFLYGAGLYLKKKTMTVLVINLVAAAINIGLNVILIPHFGLMGAAFATLISYVFQMIFITIRSNETLQLDLPLCSILKYIGISLAMIGVIMTIHGAGLILLLIKVLLGSLTYAIGILLFEPAIRTRTVVLIQKALARQW